MKKGYSSLVSTVRFRCIDGVSIRFPCLEVVVQLRLRQDAEVHIHVPHASYGLL